MDVQRTLIVFSYEENLIRDAATTAQHPYVEIRYGIYSGTVSRRRPLPLLANRRPWYVADPVGCMREDASVSGETGLRANTAISPSKIPGDVAQKTTSIATLANLSTLFLYGTSFLIEHTKAAVSMFLIEHTKAAVSMFLIEHTKAAVSMFLIEHTNSTVRECTVLGNLPLQPRTLHELLY
jgi:hypothetical protein